MVECFEEGFFFGFCCYDDVCLKVKIAGMIGLYIIENILKFKCEGCTGRDS